MILSYKDYVNRVVLEEKILKILQINSVCGVGSTGRIATDIHNILIEQGHESYIAYGRYLPNNCNTFIKIGTKYDNLTHLALTRIFDQHGFGSKRVTPKFIKEVEKLDPDVIHLHNIHGYYINIKMLFEYLKKVNKPIVWTLHDCWAFTGHCAYFDYIGCEKWKIGCFDCPQKIYYPSSLVMDKSKENYLMKKEIFTGIKNLTIITPSKWLASLAKESFLREYAVKVINNGIDLEVFKPTESKFRERYNLNNNFIILGVASVWSKRKGYQYFVELSNRLNTKEKIVLVGLTVRQKKRLPKNIIGITRTNNVKDLVHIYSEADVFVNPTLEDNFPTTNLEALACGVPVITFNAGGSIECLSKDTGLIIDRGNLSQLRDGIDNIKQLGKKYFKGECIKRAKYFFNKKDKYLEYLNLYMDLHEGK